MPGEAPQTLSELSTLANDASGCNITPCERVPPLVRTHMEGADSAVEGADSAVFAVMVVKFSGSLPDLRSHVRSSIFTDPTLDSRVERAVVQAAYEISAREACYNIVARKIFQHPSLDVEVDRCTGRSFSNRGRPVSYTHLTLPTKRIV